MYLGQHKWLASAAYFQKGCHHSCLGFMICLRKLEKLKAALVESLKAQLLCCLHIIGWLFLVAYEDSSCFPSGLQIPTGAYISYFRE